MRRPCPPRSHLRLGREQSCPASARFTAFRRGRSADTRVCCQPGCSGSRDASIPVPVSSTNGRIGGQSSGFVLNRAAGGRGRSRVSSSRAGLRDTVRAAPARQGFHAPAARDFPPVATRRRARRALRSRTEWCATFGRASSLPERGERANAASSAECRRTRSRSAFASRSRAGIPCPAARSTDRAGRWRCGAWRSSPSGSCFLLTSTHRQNRCAAYAVEVVAGNDKQQFAFDGSGTLIRAAHWRWTPVAGRHAAGRTVPRHR